MCNSTIKDTQYFYFNGLRLWPCNVLANAVNFGEVIGVVIETHFYNVPYMVKPENVLHRDDARISITSNRAGNRAVLLVEEEEE